MNVFVTDKIEQEVTSGTVKTVCLTFKAYRFLYVPTGLTIKNSTWCSLCVECFVWISELTATFAVSLTGWFL